MDAVSDASLGVGLEYVADEAEVVSSGADVQGSAVENSVGDEAGITDDAVVWGGDTEVGLCVPVEAAVDSAVVFVVAIIVFVAAEVAAEVAIGAVVFAVGEDDAGGADSGVEADIGVGVGGEAVAEVSLVVPVDSDDAAVIADFVVVSALGAADADVASGVVDVTVPLVDSIDDVVCAGAWVDGAEVRGFAVVAAFGEVVGKEDIAAVVAGFVGAAEVGYTAGVVAAVVVVAAAARVVAVEVDVGVDVEVKLVEVGVVDVDVKEVVVEVEVEVVVVVVLVVVVILSQYNPLYPASQTTSKLNVVLQNDLLNPSFKCPILHLVAAALERAWV